MTSSWTLKLCITPIYRQIKQIATFPALVPKRRKNEILSLRKTTLIDPTQEITVNQFLSLNLTIHPTPYKPIQMMKKKHKLARIHGVAQRKHLLTVY